MSLPKKRHVIKVYSCESHDPQQKATLENAWIDAGGRAAVLSGATRSSPRQRSQSTFGSRKIYNRGLNIALSLLCMHKLTETLISPEFVMDMYNSKSNGFQTSVNSAVASFSFQLNKMNRSHVRANRWTEVKQLRIVWPTSLLCFLWSPHLHQLWVNSSWGNDKPLPASWKPTGSESLILTRQIQVVMEQVFRTVCLILVAYKSITLQIKTMHLKSYLSIKVSKW